MVYGVFVDQTHKVPRTLYEMFYLSLILDEEALYSAKSYLCDAILFSPASLETKRVMSELGREVAEKTKSIRPIAEKDRAYDVMSRELLKERVYNKIETHFDSDDSGSCLHCYPIGFLFGDADINTIRERYQQVTNRVNALFIEKFDGRTDEDIFDELYDKLTSVPEQAADETYYYHNLSLHHNLQPNGTYALHNHRQLLQDVIRAETETSDDELLIYRGAKQLGNILKANCRSLSFGMSLFGGIFFDRTACVMYYLNSNPEHKLFVIKFGILPSTTSQVFYVPDAEEYKNPIQVLYAMGEWFHARTKVDKDCFKAEKIHGIHEFIQRPRPPDFQSELSQESIQGEMNKLVHMDIVTSFTFLLSDFVDREIE